VGKLELILVDGGAKVRFNDGFNECADVGFNVVGRRVAG
jgi:hypothetical protein